MSSKQWKVLALRHWCSLHRILLQRVFAPLLPCTGIAFGWNFQKHFNTFQYFSKFFKAWQVFFNVYLNKKPWPTHRILSSIRSSGCRASARNDWSTRDLCRGHRVMEIWKLMWHRNELYVNVNVTQNQMSMMSMSWNVCLQICLYLVWHWKISRVDR